MNRYNRENTAVNVWIGDTFKVILDKDNMLPQVERLEETQTLFEGAPSEEEFLGTCNEFFWVLKTFSEYTLRKELPAAMFYLNNPVRDMLNRMIRWHICLKHGTPVDMGILDSNMEKLLEKELFESYKRTYPSAEYEYLWTSFDAVVNLWNKTACSVADICGFKYPEDTEKNMIGFIRELKNK
jgi:aminoglycoside 6-adenylyltransferase